MHPHDEHVKAWKLARAKAWLKGETVLREKSAYLLDHPVQRKVEPKSPEHFYDFITKGAQHSW